MEPTAKVASCGMEVSNFPPEFKPAHFYMFSGGQTYRHPLKHEETSLALKNREMYVSWNYDSGAYDVFWIDEMEHYKGSMESKLSISFGQALTVAMHNGEDGEDSMAPVTLFITDKDSPMPAAIPANVTRTLHCYDPVSGKGFTMAQ